MIDLIKTTHTSECMRPGAFIASGPDDAPLPCGICAAVQVGMAGFDIFDLLTGISVSDPLM